MSARAAVSAAAGVFLLFVAACDRSAPEAVGARDDRTRASAAEAGSGDSTLRDNGDGTITDVATGLVWEKKCDCPDSPHHFQTAYFWSGDGEHETIWDWLDGLNSEGGDGFAGHSDWRIPNIKELVSLVDYSRADPAVAPALDPCREECADSNEPECGCAASGPTWSSTTFADFPAHALVVNFSTGGVDDQLKTLRAFVRAVRGPVDTSSLAVLGP